MSAIHWDYIKNVFVIKELERLFGKLTGLDLHIIDLENTRSVFPCSLKGRSKNCCKAYSRIYCDTIDHAILDKLIRSRMTHAFKCSAGFTKMLVPILLKEEVLGILFIGANDLFSHGDEKLDAISKSLCHIVNYIVESESGSLKYFKVSPLTHQQQVLHNVIKYLKANYDKDDVTLKEAARDNGVSYHYLSHLFKKELNTSFVKHRTDAKMEIAAKLLKDLNLTVSQISYMCGFKDPAYFCKVFKTAYSCSPGDFRFNRMSRNGNGRKNGRAKIGTEQIRA